MKHNSSILSERVILGLFSLLFILSAAQVAAILEMGDYQLAQVSSTTGAPKKCLQITHKYNTDEFFHNGASSQSPGHYYRFRGYFDIKNICNFDIHIVDPSTVNQPDTLVFTTLQGLSFSAVTAGNPVTLDPNDPIVFPASQNAPGEMISCPNCYEPNEQLAWYTSSVATVPEGIGAYRLAAGQTRNFFVQTYTSLFDGNDIVNPYQNYVRVMVNKFQWFRDIALANSAVEAQEIITQEFTAAEKKAYAGDYVKFKHSVDYPEMDGGGVIQKQ